jgi:uncharacterized membrane protein
MGLLALLFIIGVVLLIVWAIRMSSGQHGMTNAAPPAQAPGHEEAVAIAKRRLANGEITPEQYAQIMAALGS